AWRCLRAGCRHVARRAWIRRWRCGWSERVGGSRSFAVGATRCEADRCAVEATLSGRLETVSTDLTKKAAIQPRTLEWRSPTSRNSFFGPTPGMLLVTSRASVQEK